MKKIKLLFICLLAFNTLLFICLLAFNTVNSQTNPEIITDRPDATESPYTIPVSKLQIEGGFEYGSNKETGNFGIFGNQEKKEINIKTPTLLFRYGLNDITEIRAGIEYITNKIEY